MKQFENRFTPGIGISLQYDFGPLVEQYKSNEIMNILDDVYIAKRYKWKM